MNLEIFKANHGVFFISVTNDSGLEVILSTLGASIYSLKLDLEPMCLTLKDFEEFYTSGSYMGKTVGRIAGRVKDGKLCVGDKELSLDKNEGNNTLHGGYKSLAFLNFSHGVERLSNGIVVRFYLTTKKNDSGFNGKCDYIVTYKIPKYDNNIIIEYDAVCKEDTYFNLTNHTYYNLANQKDILSHHLLIKAGKVQEVDDELIPTGYKDVTNTLFDFRDDKLISKVIKEDELHKVKLNGVDHRFLFDQVDGEEIEANLALSCDMYKMKIFTDFDAVQIYMDGFNSDKELITGDKDTMYKGIAIEPVNMEPEFVKGKTHYKHKIKYVFERTCD